MLLSEKIIILCSLCMNIFDTTSSKDVIGSTTNQTSDTKSLVAGCRCGPFGNCAMDIFGRKSCVCYEGFVEIDGVCGFCDCGPVGECVVTDGVGSCNCPQGYGEKDNKCTQCDCGSVGEECRWDDYGRKICQCPKGYGLKDGICTKCLCYLNGRNDVDCSFTNDEQVCSCPPGYEERISNLCLDVSKCNEQSICPRNTKCVDNEGGYRCVCNKGFKPFGEEYDPMENGCTDINECFEQNECPFRDTTECVNTEGSYFCVCRTGYLPKGSSAEKEGCQEDLSGWRIGYIILIIFFGFASLILVLAIRQLRFSSSV